MQPRLARGLLDRDARLPPGPVVRLPGDLALLIGQGLRCAQVVALVEVQPRQRCDQFALVIQPRVPAAVVQRVPVHVVAIGTLVLARHVLGALQHARKHFHPGGGLQQRHEAMGLVHVVQRLLSHVVRLPGELVAVPAIDHAAQPFLLGPPRIFAGPVAAARVRAARARWAR